MYWKLNASSSGTCLNKDTQADRSIKVNIVFYKISNILLYYTTLLNDNILLDVHALTGKLQLTKCKIKNYIHYSLMFVMMKEIIQRFNEMRQ